MTESYCGIVCSTCHYRESFGCPTCLDANAPFWADESGCPTKNCAIQKEVPYCGACEACPCDLLEEMAYEPKEGDNGLRIQNTQLQHSRFLLEEITKYAHCLPSVTQDYKAEWDCERFQIGGKLFLSLGYWKDDETKPMLTLKLRPEQGDYYRRQYPDKFIPGYYMNKVHWNSIFLTNPWTMAFLSPLIQESYHLVLQSFSKKAQKELFAAGEE